MTGRTVPASGSEKEKSVADDNFYEEKSTMSETTDKLPCSRGCTWDAIGDEPARRKPATHGLLCSSDYYRLVGIFKMIPDLMANMRAQVSGIGGTIYGERVAGGGDPTPAPLRIGPLDASDSLYAKLVSWTEVIGGALHTPQPSVSVWMNFREAQGSRPVTVERAHEIATELVDWFKSRLDAIASLDIATELHDDLAYGWVDAPGVFTLAAAHGVEPRRERPAEKRQCPVCDAVEVFVAWPDKLNPDVSVLCSRCAWVADPAATEKHLKEITSA
jgi:hypothetical protein